MERPQRDGRRIDEAEQSLAVTATTPVELGRQRLEGIGKKGDRSARVGIGQSGACQRGTAEMIVVVAVGVPAGDQPAQAGGAAQLGIDEGQQMVPTGKGFAVGIGIVARRIGLEDATIERFQ